MRKGKTSCNVSVLSFLRVDWSNKQGGYIKVWCDTQWVESDAAEKNRCDKANLY